MYGHSLTKTLSPINAHYAVFGAIFLLCGYFFYLIFRQFDPLSIEMFRTLTQIDNVPVLSDYLCDSLPTFFHSIGFTLLTISYFEPTKANRIRVVLFWLLINVMFEILQMQILSSEALISGTFDVLDIVSLVLAGFFGYVITNPYSSLSLRSPNVDVTKPVDSLSKYSSVSINTKNPVFYLLFLTSIFFTLGCDESWTDAEPVYMSYEELRKPLVVDKEHPVNYHYKPYVAESYLLIPKKNEGVFVYDNSDIKNPKYMGFVVIPGNKNIAVKDGYLYADSFIDLLVIDLSDSENIHVAKRVENAFPYNPYLVLNSYTYLINVDTSKGVVIDSVPLENQPEDNYDRDPGKWSNARNFTLFGDKLYLLLGRDLSRFDISQPLKPGTREDFSLAWKTDNLQLVNDRLFIHTRERGLKVLNISDPNNPVNIIVNKLPSGQYSPRIRGDYAFYYKSCYSCEEPKPEPTITIYNIKDLEKPVKLATWEMDFLQDIFVKQNYLFMCNNEYELDVYQLPVDNESNTLEFDPVDIGNVIKCNYITVTDDVLIINRNEKLSQYSYANIPFVLESEIKYSQKAYTPSQ